MYDAIYDDVYVCGIEPIKRDIHSYASNMSRKPPSDHKCGIEPIKRDIHSYASNMSRKPPSDHKSGIAPDIETFKAL